MAAHQLCVAFLLFPRLVAGAPTCDPVGNDANVLLQTSLVPRKASMRELFETAAASSQQGSTISLDEVATQKQADIDRPNVGKGPDYIQFGVMPKAFYGIDMVANRYTIDTVITLDWTDKRNIHLIPKGATNVTLSESEAEGKVWLPQVSVTNRNIGKLDPISTGVMLHESGRVVKVQRVIVQVKDKFQAKEYPFDSQEVPIKIASTQYMSSELVLTPSSEPNMSGCPNELYDGSGFSLDSWKVYAFEDNNGLLKKSRGVMNMQVTRDFGGYMSTHLMPCIFICALACSVFFFPFSNPFIMPRLAMSVLAYLTFVNQTDSSDAALSPTPAVCWNDIQNQTLLLPMLVAACFNLYCEVRHHITKVEGVATRMNYELRFVFPILNVLFISLVMLFGANHVGMSALDITMKVLLALAVIAYVVVCELRTKEALRAKREADLSFASEAFPTVPSDAKPFPGPPGAAGAADTFPGPAGAAGAAGAADTAAAAGPAGDAKPFDSQYFAAPPPTAGGDAKSFDSQFFAGAGGSAAGPAGDSNTRFDSQLFQGAGGDQK